MTVGPRRQEIREARDQQARASLPPPKKRAPKKPAEPPDETPPDRIRRACSDASTGFDLEAHAARVAEVARRAKQGG